MKFRSQASARVAKLLMELGPSSATVLANSLSMTPTAMRKHLEALESAGFVTAHDKAPFGPKVDTSRGRGRPSKIFTVTQTGREFFEAPYDEIALSALQFMEQNFGKQSIRDFAKSRIESVFAEFDESNHGVTQLAQELSDHGFSASVQPAPFANAEQLCQHNCPISHIASVYPEFCEVEAEIIGKKLGVHVTRISTIASGSAICTTNIPHNTPRRSA